MFSQTCKYAIRAVLFLAMHVSLGKKVGVKEIAEALSVPQAFLAKILQQLSKSGIISSTKGPNGGFFMTPENLETAIIQVVITFDGEGVFNSCVLGLPTCSSENPCPLHMQAFAFREGLYYQLKHQTIGEIAKRAERDALKL